MPLLVSEIIYSRVSSKGVVLYKSASLYPLILNYSSYPPEKVEIAREDDKLEQEVENIVRISLYSTGSLS